MAFEFACEIELEFKFQFELEFEFELAFDSEFRFEFEFELQSEFTCALDVEKLNFGLREGHFGRLSGPGNWTPVGIWHPGAPPTTSPRPDLI